MNLKKSYRLGMMRMPETNLCDANMASLQLPLNTMQLALMPCLRCAGSNTSCSQGIPWSRFQKTSKNIAKKLRKKQGTVRHRRACDSAVGWQAPRSEVRSRHFGLLQLVSENRLYMVVHGCTMSWILFLSCLPGKQTSTCYPCFALP